jgi:hypothetical protein
MAVITNRRRPRRQSLAQIAAKNGELQVKVDVLYNLLVTCRDWLKVMGADLGKISKIEGTLAEVRRTQ